jgi:hypothetical protein
MHGCSGLHPLTRKSLQAHARDLVGAGFATLILDSSGPRKLTGERVCAVAGFRQSGSGRTMHSTQCAPCRAMPRIIRRYVGRAAATKAIIAQLRQAKGGT